ncbi:MAG: alpha/beta fold hydrolase [Leptospiraceae bacterium]|nr:alpha/beta fold hydrolase [Leptospiraceae bacterium]MCB1201785.1 alpha/beta fold hydrolase [Leptospiraceae bacterium]
MQQHLNPDINPLGTVYPVLLIHGLFSRGDAWRETRLQWTTRYDLKYGGDYSLKKPESERTITAGDFYTVTFSDNHDLNFTDQALELKTVIAEIKKINEASKVVLIGHSMGGLAARAYVQEVDSADVFLLITIGTPHYGAPLAILRNSSESFAMRSFNVLQSRLMKLAAGEDQEQKKHGFFKRIWKKISQTTNEGERELRDFLNSSAFLALAPGSDQLQKLNSEKLPSEVRYIFIVGDVSFQPILMSTMVSRFRRKLSRKWSKFIRQSVHGLTRQIMTSALESFQKVLVQYEPDLEDTENQEKLLDSDGVVPVVSQAIRHFTRKPAMNLIIVTDSWHMAQMRRADKLYQALALGGALTRTLSKG